MLHFSVPLSITSLIWAYHSLHMPFQTILAFCVILQQYNTLFYRNVSSLIQTCTHFSGLALLLFTNAVEKKKVHALVQYTVVEDSVDSCSWFCR